MPFAHGPYDFTEEGINNIKQEPGVYGITNAELQMIYIGETESLPRRLLEHYSRESEESECIWRYSPKKFYAEIVKGGAEARRKREAESIEEYDPPCNKD